MQRYAVTCLKLASTGGDSTKLGAPALSLLSSATAVSECLICPYKISRRESSKCNDVVLKQRESCSGMPAVFFFVFPFHIQLWGLSGGAWSGCHMKFIRGDKRKQLSVLMLFLSIVEICDVDYVCFA